MKNKLLKEFLSYILTEKTLAQTTMLTFVDKDGKSQTRSAAALSRYPKGSKGKEAYDKWKSSQGKEAPGSAGSQAPEQPGQPQRTAADTTAGAPPGGAKPGSPAQSPEVQKSIKSIKRLEKSASPQGKQFIAALESGNPEVIQKVVQDFGITVTKEGKIKGMSIQGNSDAQKLFGDNKNAPLYVNKILEAAGLPLLPVEAIPRAEDGAKPPASSGAEGFKPSSVFSDRPEVTTEIHADGVTIGNSEYKILSTYSPDSPERKMLMVERENLSEIQRRDPDLTPEEVERKIDNINGIIDTHNTRVRFLQAEIQRGGKFRDLGSGKEAVDLIHKRLVGVLDGTIPAEIKDEVNGHLETLANASTVEEFEAGWIELNKTLEKAKLPSGSVPLICEHLTAMRNAMLGSRVMLPQSDSFKLGDIISYSETGVKTQDVRSLVDGVQLIEVGLDIGSVKRDTGAASTVGSRTDASTFAGEGVPATLSVLGRSPVKRKDDPEGKGDPGTIGEIHGTKTQEELDVVQEKIVGAIRERMGDVRSYYRIPESTSDDEIIGGLGRGGAPTYDKQGNFTGFSEENDKFSATDPDGNPISELNRNQLALYSLAGFAYDAIYNRNCTGQAFSNTTFKRDKIVVSDGIRVMGQSRFQFNKNMAWRRVKGKDGEPPSWVLRDDGVAAQIRPVPRNQMGTF